MTEVLLLIWHMVQMRVPDWCVSWWVLDECKKICFWIAGEDSSLTEGVWSVVVCLLAGALPRWWHRLPHSNGADADTSASLPAAFPVPTPRHGLSGVGFVSVPALGDTVLVSSLVPVQFVGRSTASFAECVHFCKYNLGSSWKVTQRLNKPLHDIIA